MQCGRKLERTFSVATMVSGVHILVFMGLFVQRSVRSDWLFKNVVEQIKTGYIPTLPHYNGPPVRNTRAAPSRNHQALLQDTLVPFHYNLMLKPNIYLTDEETFRLDGHVIIYFECRRPTNRIILHANGLDVHAVGTAVIGIGRGMASRIRVSSSSYSEQQHFLTLRLNARLIKGRKYTISLGYSTPIKRVLAGVYLTGYEKDGETHYAVVSQFAPDGARKAFPCFDEPKLKATFNITILRKGSHVALSNMPVSQSNLLEDGWVEDIFEQSPIMATYLVAIVVAEYRFKERVSRRGTVVRVWNRPDQIDEVEFALDIAVKALDYMENYTGIQYDLPKIDHVPTNDFSLGAMENWGLILYRSSLLLLEGAADGSRPPQDLTGVIASVVCHEVAHQWFGNLVTTRWWNDVWINEAVTAFMEMKTLEAVYPKFDPFTRHLHQRSAALAEDSYITAHPIDKSVYFPDELSSVFNMITYIKGSLVVSMLESVLGKDIFRIGMQNLLRRYKYKNADQYDFYDAFNEALLLSDNPSHASLDVGEFMSTWIQQAGYPVITIIRDEDGLRVNEERFLLDPETPQPEEYKSPFGDRWVIPLFISTNASGEATDLPVVWMNDKELNLSATTSFHGRGQDVWVIGNRDLQGYYIVNYDEANWQLIAHQLQIDHEVIPPKNRVQILEDSAKLVRAGKVHPLHSFRLTKYMKKERNAYPWEEYFKIMSSVGDKLMYTSHFGLFRNHVIEALSAIYEGILWELDEEKFVPKGSLISIRKEVLKQSCRYEYQPCIDKAKELFENREIQPIPSDLRPVVYCSVLRFAPVELWDEVYNVFKEASDESYTTRMDLLAGLSCSSNRWILERFLRRATHDASIQDIIYAEVARNPFGSQIAFQQLLLNWDKLTLSTKEYFGSVCEKMTTPEDLNTLERFIKSRCPGEEQTAQFTNSMVSCKEKIKANVKWLEGDAQHILNWLSSIYV